MANPRNGKSFFLTFYFLITLTLLFISPSYANESPVILEETAVSVTEPTREDALLHKLEELVKNLTEIVSNLDAKLSESKNEISKSDDEELVRGGGRAKAFSVTKYSPFWTERFSFTSAVKLDSDATCINVLPFKDFEGSSKYFAIGDSRGRVYVFLRNGDVLVEFFTTVDSPVTAMVSYLSMFKNSSFVVTGHQNGAVLFHRIHEGSNGEDWNSNSVSMEHVGAFDVDDSADDPVTLLEVHHVGRVRYILATDLSGKLTVLTENRTVHGSVIPSSRPLVFLKQRLLFLTESGAGSLDLRSMKIRETECEGLNHSLARSYVFDATERSKAYGFTSEGEIIHVLLHGDIMNFKCRVRSKKKFQMEEPVALQSIKGYLLVINEEKVFAFNVSTQHYVRTAGPRLLFSAGLEEIRSSFLSHRQTRNVAVKARPLVASDRENLLVIGLGDGYFGVYKSKLPSLKGEFNTMLWSSPVFFFILFLFGAWHFFAKKKESLTAWGPDDPFTPTAAGQNSAGKEPSFTEPARRNDDLMDLRRRYVGASPYRSVGGGNEQSSRAPVDGGGYRTTAQDHNNYRGGSGLDSSGFGNRRDSLYGNNKVMDDES
ncbi:F18 [Hirschfeldia incana]|nr:F18 [Hirschfeldia incana]